MVEVVVYRGGQRHYMSLLATVSDLSWTTGWKNGRPAGLQEVTWSMDLSANTSPPVLMNGALVELFDGPVSLGKAQLSEPQRGEPWQLYARGLGSVLAECLALDATNNPTSVPSVAIDQAIARSGLPLVRGGGISTSAYSSTATNLNTVGALLDAACGGSAWGVDPSGTVFAAADPTTPSLLVMPGQGVMGVADDEYYSHIYARYVTAVSGTPPAPSAWATAVASDADAAARWGRKEGLLDLTPLGVMTAGRASTLVQERLNDGRARMGWTNAVTPDIGSLLTIGMVAAHLPTVAAGLMMAIAGVLDTQGDLVVGGMQNVVIGETKYTDGDASIYLAPVGLVDRDFASVLAAPDAPEEEFTG